MIHIKWFISEVFSLMCPIYRQSTSSFLDSASRASFIGTPCICAGLAPCIWTSKPLSFLHLPLLDMSDPIWHSISYPIPIVGNQDTFMRECGYRIIITVRPSARLTHHRLFYHVLWLRAHFWCWRLAQNLNCKLKLKSIIFHPNSRQSRHIHVGMQE